MNNSYQLYLKLDKSEDGLMLKQFLQEAGFLNYKKTGSNIANFRNYYFQIPEAPNQLELHFRILPNETKVSTIAIKLFFSCPSVTLKALFTRLSFLEDLLPFKLLDLELRNRNYSESHKKSSQGAGFSPLQNQQDKAEKTAYIPISFDDFFYNTFNIDKRKQFFIHETKGGEKAPADLAGKPRAKGN